MKTRMEIVNKHSSENALVVDVGAGACTFVKARPNTVGYDVNLHSVAELKALGKWVDIEQADKIPVATFWDSLEHIKDPEPLLRKITEWLFVSIPIYENYNHLIKSKHFRPEEHYHYHTHVGLVSYLWNLGFRLKWFGNPESVLGRDGIKTYAFKRVVI